MTNNNRIPDEVLAGSKIVVHVEIECDEIPDTIDVLHGLRRATEEGYWGGNYWGRVRKVHMIREKDGVEVQTVHGGVVWEGDNLRSLLGKRTEGND